MCPYEEAFTLDADSSEARLGLAAELLKIEGSVVILDQTLAIRRAPTYLSCEVIDQNPLAHRCENEFEVSVENAQRVLAASRLGALLPTLPQKWRVVADDETGAIELWHAP